MEDISSNAQIHERTLRVFAILLFLLGPLISPAQQLSTQSKKANKLYLKADKKYKERDFVGAIALLEEATKSDPSFYEAFIRMGSLYNALGQEDSTYQKFLSYLKVAPNPVTSILERMSFMAFDRGQYEQSMDFLNRFLTEVPEKLEDREISILKESLQFAISQMEKPIELEIIELPKEVNRYALQYLPTMTVDGNTLVYTERAKFSSDEDIVVSYKSGSDWSESKSISERINSTLNEGAASISADGRTMIFTSCDRRDSFGSCDLYISKKLGDVWSRPKNLGNSINSKYWESQPSLSADGKTLYFASNRPGGFGKRDLWVASFSDGQWKKPVNLGSQVNSFKDETTPFIHFNNETLYFSSNSYPGMGGFDLFAVEKQDTVWSKPKNLEYPINSYRDEVALLVSSDGAEGYFAKEVQKNREILESNIVRFEIPQRLKPRESYFLTGKIVNKDTGQPLRAALQIIDISTNQILYSNNSDSLSGEYYLVLPTGRDLAGYIKKKGYLYEDFSFSTDTATTSDTLNIALRPIKENATLVLRNIYFETNSYELDSRSQSEIESVVELLDDNPDISVEITGHTDDIGSEEYNLNLSLKRAESVFSALLSRGIDRNRLKFNGLGDSQPLKPNVNDFNRRSNRRIEFRVLRMSR